uniref:Uncharacterized protein n=1 Tax=Anguilla anguilla TaxID=7936 RepID=A0A0E9PJ08_ANGAN
MIRNIHTYSSLYDLNRRLLNLFPQCF